MAYVAIQEGSELSGGKSINRRKQLKVYEKIYEVALLNESLSQDEWRVIRYIKELFDISDDEDKKVLENIKRFRTNKPLLQLADRKRGY